MIHSLNRMEADVAIIGIFSIGATLMIVNVQDYLQTYNVEEDIMQASNVIILLIVKGFHDNMLLGHATIKYLYATKNNILLPRKYIKFNLVIFIKQY